MAIEVKSYWRWVHTEETLIVKETYDFERERKGVQIEWA